jgi:hypothetical protein
MALRFEYIFEVTSSLNFLEILNHVGDCIIPILPEHRILLGPPQTS